MKISINTSEYQLLLDVIYMADWILHSHDTESRSDTQEYLNLFQKLMSYAKEMGHGDLVEFNKELKTWSESFTFEAESAAPDYIDEFENDTFWSELISRLAQRDALKVFKTKNIEDVDTERLFFAIANMEEKWSKEFAVYGLDRILSGRTQYDAIH
jgi:hypothetical protein